MSKIIFYKTNKKSFYECCGNYQIKSSLSKHIKKCFKGMVSIVCCTEKKALPFFFVQIFLHFWKVNKIFSEGKKMQFSLKKKRCNFSEEKMREKMNYYNFTLWLRNFYIYIFVKGILQLLCYPYIYNKMDNKSYQLTKNCSIQKCLFVLNVTITRIKKVVG